MDVKYVASDHEVDLREPLTDFASTFGIALSADGETRSGVPKILNSRWMMESGSGTLDSLVSRIEGNRPLVVYGQFFRYPILKPYKHKIRNEWIALDRSQWPDPPESTLCVHMRLGDLARHGWHLNQSYYERAIGALDWDEIVVVTDEPDHAVVRHVVRRFGARLAVSGYWPNDFALICSHKRIVTSESTFSWWAAWLSDAHVIASPGPNLDRRQFGGRSWFSDKCDPLVDDENRYVYIE